MGVQKLRGEDSVRRAFQHASNEALTPWMDVHLNESFAPLLSEGWILDVDATIKPLYGQQEEARLGYNPTKPGRPSHCYQTMLISSIRMILNVDVQAGNQTAPAYARPGLWGWLESREKKDWPCLLRGDLAWGTEGVMREAERPERKIPYLFKLRQTQGVLEKIAYLAKQGQWQRVGDGWEGAEDQIQLQGWTRTRRVIVLRRGINNAVLENRGGESGQAWLSGVEPRKGHLLYEYSVLVTSLRSRDYLMLPQLYRDRAETENVFDELKNQWGWTGYTTQDLQRSQLMARIVALIFNWWNLYSRLALPDKHAEAITTRPMFSHGAARGTSHSGQSHLTITSNHGHASKVMRTLAQISNLLKNFRQNAEQFAQELRWPMLLRLIFKKFYETIPAPKPLPVPS